MYTARRYWTSYYFSHSVHGTQAILVVLLHHLDPCTHPSSEKGGWGSYLCGEWFISISVISVVSVYAVSYIYAISYLSNVNAISVISVILYPSIHLSIHLSYLSILSTLKRRKENAVPLCGCSYFEVIRLSFHID